MSIFERWLSEPSARRPARRALTLGVGLVLCLGAMGLPEARAQGVDRPSASASASGALRRQLEGRYEVLPLRDGLMLRPRTERSGVRSIEVSGASIAVNGERVNDAVLRAWLGEDAGPLLQLLALPSAERRAMFGLSTPGAGSSGTASPAPSDTAGDDASGDETDSSGADSSGDSVTELPAVPAPPGAPEAPEVPEAPAVEPESNDANVRIGTLVRFAGSARVDADEEAEQVVVIGGPATVDGSVQQEVTAIGGRVTVNGRVGGDVISVGGSVHLGPKAEVDGDVTSVGGSVEREPGAKVHGQINQAAGFGPRIHIGGDDRDFDFWPWWSPFAGAMRLMWSILTLAIFALLVAVTVVVARDPVARVEAKIAGEFWQSGLAGFLAQLLFIPLFVLVTVVLVVSIVGIPLLVLYPFLILALIVGGLIGFSSFALWVGRLVERRFDRRYGSAVATALVGLFAIEICRIVGRLLSVGNGPLDVFGWFFSITGFLLSYIAWTVGFGAVILTRFGMGPRRPRGVVPDVPPYDPYAAAPLAPIPPVPPIVPREPVESIEPVEPIGSTDSVPPDATEETETEGEKGETPGPKEPGAS